MFGKVVLKPGARALDTRRIRASTDRKTIWVGRAGGEANEAGTVTEEIDLVAHDGRPAIRRTLVVDSKVTGNQRTVIVVDAETLRPIAHETRAAKLKVNAHFSPGKVSGIRKEGNHTQAMGGLEVPKDVLDLSSIELVLRAVDLSEGWSAKLNAADPIGGRVVRVNLDVTGSETIDGHDCWIVESKVDRSTVSYWIARDEPKILKQAFSPSKGVKVEFRAT
jgi:hypothetical protein